MTDSAGPPAAPAAHQPQDALAAPKALASHNTRQRAYFEETLKRTMLPADTPYVRRHVDKLLRVAGLQPGALVLEVGCGMGRYTFALAQRGLQVEGLDVSPVLLDRLRAFDGGRYGIPLHCADVVECPPHLRDRFDAVVGFFTLHHLHDLPLCFRAMAGLVRPGGKVAFLEPNPLNPLYYVQILVTPGMSWRGDGGMTRMRRPVIFDAMRRAGLTQFTMERCGFFPPALANVSWGAKVEAAMERVRPLRVVLPFQIFIGERG